MCGEPESKKPRLFYYEEAVDAWIPVPENEVTGIIDIDHFSNDGEVIELQSGVGRDGREYWFHMGLAKARAVDENIDRIRMFVDKHTPESEK